MFRSTLFTVLVALLALVVPVSPAFAETPQPIWSPRIAIVWPHDA